MVVCRSLVSESTGEAYVIGESRRLKQPIFSSLNTLGELHVSSSSVHGFHNISISSTVQMTLPWVRMKRFSNGATPCFLAWMIGSEFHWICNLVGTVGRSLILYRMVSPSERQCETKDSQLRYVLSTSMLPQIFLTTSFANPRLESARLSVQKRQAVATEVGVKPLRLGVKLLQKPAANLGPSTRTGSYLRWQYCWWKKSCTSWGWYFIPLFSKFDASLVVVLGFQKTINRIVVFLFDPPKNPTNLGALATKISAVQTQPSDLAQAVAILRYHLASTDNGEGPKQVEQSLGIKKVKTMTYLCNWCSSRPYFFIFFGCCICLSLILG